MPAATRGSEKQSASGGHDDGEEEQRPADLNAVLAAIQAINDRLDKQDRRTTALEQSSGWTVLDGTSSDAGGHEGRAAAADEARVGSPAQPARPTCRLEGCTRPAFVEDDGRVHAYCGRAHARAAGALSIVEEDGSDDEAGVDPDRRRVQPDAISYDDGLLSTQVSRLLQVPDFRFYLDDLRKSDKDRASLVEDLLAIHEELQILTLEAREARGVLPIGRLGPVRRRVEQALDAFVVFPAANGGAKAHRYVHVARRAFAEQEGLAGMYFTEGARGLGLERSRKEFEQCCAALKKLPLDELKESQEGGARGVRGGKKKRRQQPRQSPSPQPRQQQPQQQQQRRPQQPSPDPSRRRRERGRSGSGPRGGGGAQGAAAGAAPGP